jgi:predicted methyltransferase
MSALRWFLIGVAIAGLSACSKSPPESAPTAAAPASTPASAAAPSAVDAALANPNRMPGDAAEDAWRHSAAVLTFLNPKPGAHVVDYFSAGGYNTELLSYIVGPQGQVVAYNNAPYLKFAADKPEKRYGGNRLPNVAQLTTAPEEAPFEPNSLDAALFVLSYHDLYWRPKDGSWPTTDPAKALAKLVPALKSGATVVVVDHAAKPGSDPLVGVDALHRIDPAVVKRDFEAAGLVADGELDALRNSADDYLKPVFDPAVQHKTDRFVMRFKKP